MSARGGESRLRRRLAGAVLYAVVIGFLALQIAIYQKAFTPVVHVLLRTDHVGNQLRADSDVKLRGVVVGEVRAIRATGRSAELDLALQPDEARMIPRDVGARLLPKTLFGERYVSLLPPARASGASLSDGDVISQDRSSTSMEIERVLNDVLPTLRAVRPDKLATTLGAASRALDGRGAELGDTAVLLNDYLKQINPELPDLAHDLGALGDVAGTYSEAGPELVRALRNASTTTRTAAEQRHNVDGLLSTLTRTSDDADRFVTSNGANLVGLAGSARPAAELLAEYSPEYPCLFGGLADLLPRINEAVGGGTEPPHKLRLTMELAQDVRKYEPGEDVPRYLDRRGPRCYPPAPAGQNFRPPPEGMPRDGTSGSSSDGFSPQWSGMLTGPLVPGREVPR